MTTTHTYTTELCRAIQIAQAIAKEFHHENFSPAHLLKGLLHNDVGLATYLVTIGKDIHYLRDWADVRIEDYPKFSGAVDEPYGDAEVLKTLEVSDVVRLKLSEDNISPLAVLAAMCRANVGFTKEQLKTFPITENELLEAHINEASLERATSAPAQNGTPRKTTTKALHKYCVDRTALAQEGKLDPIIGRDREIRMVAEILGRRTKPNVIIAGEPGVGKTALVDGFALDIIAGKVPSYLESALLFELDMGSLIAGASYKGEVEDRLKNIIAEIKQFDKAILFIDEIHILLDSTGGAGGAANLLKPELARGAITLIGATTNEEYRKFIESDEAFNRRFEILRVEEPDEPTAVRMINTLLPFYEEHHDMKVDAQTVPSAVRFAKRYVKDRRLPDAAIDLLDRTMSAIHNMNDTSSTEIEELTQQLNTLKESDKTDEEQVADLQWFYTQMKNKISPILFGRLEDDDIEVNKITDKKELTDYLEKITQKLVGFAEGKKESVEPTDIAAVVSHKTGIPLGKIQTKEREKLLNMEDELKKRVIGQDQAIKSVSEAVLESRSGLTKAGQPIGSFFFLGPTGTGKTELAKSIASFLFNDENALLRFDMSEFKEEHSAALLYGAPPGYVGYKEGGLLVNKIRQQPYSVVLFDEIEKAHKSVFDIFLQILDEGKLKDKLDKEGDFSNAIILFTSNIGSQHIVSRHKEGSLPTSNELLEIMSSSGYFRPEFLGRLTEIVPFAPITEENIVKIFEIHYKKLVKTLAEQGITLEATTEAKEKLAKEGFTPEYGARPLQGIIRTRLRKPISRMIVSGQVKKGDVIKVELDENDKLKWS